MPLDPATYPGLDALGRIPLSDNFFFREFLYSEVAAHYGVKNIPSDCDLAIQAGRGLCENLLEPLNATFGRINLTWSDRPIRHAEAKFGKKGGPRTLPTETAESAPGLHRAEYEEFPELARR